MEYYAKTEEDTEYVCAAEFYSLSDEGKIKIIMHQVEFCTKTKSIFIHGYKDIHVPLRIDATEEDVEGSRTVTQWLHKRLTSYRQKMFSRVYQVQNGLVELYTPTENHKEAIDWARLSTSASAKELNDKSMAEIFINPKDALEKMAVQPDWKPHTLAKRIEQLVTPETIKYQSRRRQVAMSYTSENTQEKEKQRSKNKQRKDKNKTKEATKETTNSATTITEPKKAWTQLDRSITMTAATQEEGTDETTTTNQQKAGTNKYKVAAAAQDKRMK